MNLYPWYKIIHINTCVQQVGAELCQAQVKLEVVAEVGCRDCSWSKPHSVWVKVTTCPDGWVDGG